MTATIALLVTAGFLAPFATARQPESIELDAATRAKCVEVLRAGLRSGEFWPSIHAAEGLTIGGHGDEVRAILKPLLLIETDDQKRCGISRELVRAGDRAQVQVMLDILAGTDPHGHVHAAESLYKVGDIGDGMAMRAAFAKRDNIKLSLMAAGALARTGDAAAMKYIREGSLSEAPEARQISSWLLARIGDSRDIEPIAEAENTEADPLIKAYHQHALATLGDEYGMKSLEANLSSDDPAFRTYAATFAGDARAVHLAEKLTTLLDDDNLDTRVRAAQSLLDLANAPPDPSDLSVLDETELGVPANQILYRHLAAQAKESLAKRRERFEAIETADDSINWQKAQREFFIEQLGGFPERTPLNAEVVGELDGGDYRIEKVIYESRPNHHVTATLYLPKSAGPYPGVLIACGHTKTGKAADYNQKIGILLARNGMAALCYDPIGQGERAQILNDDGTEKYSSSTTEHFLVGVGSILAGTNTAQYRIRDGIRGIDYLCSRDDIIADKIGCTGCSGGGTLTSYIMALDDRVYCAAPACYLTTFDKLLDTIGPQDAEQNIFGQLAFGMDHPDYVIMRAPKPTLIVSTTGDFFDISGTWDCFRQAKRVYSKLGHSERIDMIESPGGHGVTDEGREAIARWMSRWLLGNDQVITDPGAETWTVAQLQCTPKGQVLLLDGEKSVFHLNRERIANLRRTALEPDALRNAIRMLAEIRTPRHLRPLSVRVTERIQRDHYEMRKLIITPIDGIPLPALRFTPRTQSRSTVLYVNGAGKSSATEPDSRVLELVTAGNEVIAVDLAGIGETRGEKSSDLLGDWKDYFTAYLNGGSLVGIRAENLLTCALWLQAEIPSRKIRLMADGETAIAALHAIALQPDYFTDFDITSIPDSWDHMLEAPDTANQLANAVHGAALHYDIPELLELAEE